jgi:hypothetical protein
LRQSPLPGQVSICITIYVVTILGGSGMGVVFGAFYFLSERFRNGMRSCSHGGNRNLAFQKTLFCPTGWQAKMRAPVFLP